MSCLCSVKLQSLAIQVHVDKTKMELTACLQPTPRCKPSGHPCPSLVTCSLSCTLSSESWKQPILLYFWFLAGRDSIKPSGITTLLSPEKLRNLYTPRGFNMCFVGYYYHADERPRHKHVSRAYISADNMANFQPRKSYDLFFYWKVIGEW